MIKTFSGLGLSLVLMIVLSFSTHRAEAQYENTYVSYNDFYQNLAPYGQWIEDPRYGYVWSPNVDGSFRPYYTNGYWAMTDYGNTWVSDYSWGWACFHYGRWTYDNYYGWLWIPGNYWGPAWVSWRCGDGYYGWAPLGPDYTFSGDYACPNDWWVFIPPKYIYTGNYYHYWNGPRGNSGIIRNTVFTDNVYENNHVKYVSGPHTKDIETATGTTVTQYHLKNSTGNFNTRVHNNEIKMFRPAEIRPAAATSTGQRPAPPDVVTAPQAIKTPQSVNSGQATPPAFRDDIPQNAKPASPGTNIAPVAEPAKPAPRYNNNPYEWDVNKSVPQTKQSGETTQQQETFHQPQPEQRPQPQQQRPQPQAQPAPRSMPQAQPVQRSQPAPQQSRPAPPQPRSQPAPAPQRR